MKTKRAVGFSTGKIILSGEHSVVYGYPAVVSAISRGITVYVQSSKLGVTLPQIQTAYEAHILQLFSKKYGVETDNIAITSSSQLVNKSGLGSSAAFAHALVRALLQHFSLTATQDEIFELVYAAEIFIHKKPSGIDPHAVVYGATHFFQKNNRAVLLTQKLKCAKPETFLIVNSGTATESTGQMVEKVAQTHKQKNLSKIFIHMGAVSQKISTSLQKGTYIGEYLDENQSYLEEIGVVGSRAKKMISRIRQQGGSAKVTGAGGVQTGSGWILAHSPDIEKLRSFANASGWENFTSTVQ